MTTNAINVHTKDIVARVVYGHVKDIALNSVLREDVMICDDLDGGPEFKVVSRELIETFTSGTHYDSVEEKTKTQLAEILVNAGWMPFTVKFEKVDGTLRTLTGILVKPEPLLGRSLVRDLREENFDDLRLVDHRTIQWITVDSVRYVLKGTIWVDHTLHSREKLPKRDSKGRFTRK